MTTEPRCEARFLAAIVPYRDKAPAPRMQKLAPGMIEVAVDGERGDVIAFGERRDDAFVVIDEASIGLSKRGES